LAPNPKSFHIKKQNKREEEKEKGEDGINCLVPPRRWYPLSASLPTCVSLSNQKEKKENSFHGCHVTQLDVAPSKQQQKKKKKTNPPDDTTSKNRFHEKETSFENRCIFKCNKSIILPPINR